MKLVGRLKRLLIGASIGPLILATTSCSYRLRAGVPIDEKIRVIAKEPQEYVAQVEGYSGATVSVPPDGRLSLTMVNGTRGCDVYFLDLIKVRGYGGGKSSAKLRVQEQGRTVKTLSLREIKNLKTDSDGYHLLELPN